MESSRTVEPHLLRALKSTLGSCFRHEVSLCHIICQLLMYGIWLRVVVGHVFGWTCLWLDMSLVGHFFGWLAVGCIDKTPK